MNKYEVNLTIKALANITANSKEEAEGIAHNLYFTLLTSSDFDCIDEEENEILLPDNVASVDSIKDLGKVDDSN